MLLHLASLHLGIGSLLCFRTYIGEKPARLAWTPLLLASRLSYPYSDTRRWLTCDCYRTASLTFSHTSESKTGRYHGNLQQAWHFRRLFASAGHVLICLSGV
jgi:hypothetical protein